MTAGRPGETGRIGRFGGAPWTGRGASMDELARFLSGRLGKPVVDDTGLRGGYNFTLTWTPGEGERAGVGRRASGDGAGSDTGSKWPFDLRRVAGATRAALERRRVKPEVIVIDSARLPSAN
jgi:uncharacterized protein (TIGR03435 family)